jgi:hypothetical protein
MDCKSRIFGKSDKAGNNMLLRVFSDETGHDNKVVVYLNLASEGKRRRDLGYILYPEYTFYCKRETKKHFFQKAKGFGFNYDIINDPFLEIKYIVLEVDGTHKYKFPKTILDSYGIVLNFKQQGFELQKFLPMELIKQYRVYENSSDSD